MSTILGNPITLGGGGGGIKISRVLDENSWRVIKLVSSLGTGANYWAVGDCKEITMNGKVSDGLTLSNYTTWVFIIGFDHNKEREGTGIAFQGFKTAKTNGKDVCLVDNGYNKPHTSGTWFNINNTNTSSGGWEASLMRKNVMPLIKASFPADLQEVIKPSTIFTTQGKGNGACTATEDEIFLLAEYEVSGTHKDASSQEPNYLKQYSYYSAGNSKVKYKHNATSNAAYWWTRSPYYGDSVFACYVYTDGDITYDGASKSEGVAPCFKV